MPNQSKYFNQSLTTDPRWRWWSNQQCFVAQSVNRSFTHWWIFPDYWRGDASTPSTILIENKCYQMKNKKIRGLSTLKMHEIWLISLQLDFHLDEVFTKGSQLVNFLIGHPVGLSNAVPWQDYITFNYVTFQSHCKITSRGPASNVHDKTTLVIATFTNHYITFYYITLHINHITL